MKTKHIEIASSIPTRGDVDNSEIAISLITAFPTQSVYRAFYVNSQDIDFQVFSRYVNAARIEWAHYIYTQDDDCLVDILSIINDPVVIDAMQSGHIICNMPDAHYTNYKDTPEKLVGFGCLFPRALIAPTFNRYLHHFPMDYLLLREADRIFTGLNTHKTLRVNHPITHLPHANSRTRMYREPHHEAFRQIARANVQTILNLTP